MKKRRISLRSNLDDTFPPDNTHDLIPTLELPAFPKLDQGLGKITPQTLHLIHDGLCRVGAVRIENTIPPMLVEALLREAAKVFALPDTIKQRSLRTISKPFGYTPPGIEGVRGHGPDHLRHFWDVNSNELIDPELETRPFYMCAKVVFQQLLRLSLELFQVIDRLFKTRIYQQSLGGQHLLRVSQYLNQTTSPWKIVFPSHRDFGLLTAYIGGAASGLQVKIDEAWHDVWNPSGSVIFGVGTTLKMFAPNDLIAIHHRVVGSQTGRISGVLFTEPHPDVVLPNGDTSGKHLDNLMRQVRRT